VTTLLIPRDAYAAGGPAAGRAIAYLAHEYLGHAFGSIYDASTIAILWFAGASATAGLLHLVPRYLPRFGMAPSWVSHLRPLVLIFFGVEVLVTLAFDANVEAQAGAYATGVLVLMLSAAIAVVIAFAAEATSKPGAAARPLAERVGRTAAAIYFALVSPVFAYTLLDNVHARPDGLLVAGLFIASILLLGALSRTVRSTELRVPEIAFEDDESTRLWRDIVGRQVNLIPLSGEDAAARERKRAKICRHYTVRGPLAFLQVRLVDDRSEFTARLRVRVRRVDADYVVEVFGAVAIANTIAYVSELIDPIGVFLALGRRNLMRQAVGCLFWGEGEVALLVYTILLRYWRSTPEDDVRPRIFLMSA